MGDSEALRYAVQAAMPSAALMREVDAVIRSVYAELDRQGFAVVPKRPTVEMAQVDTEPCAACGFDADTPRAIYAAMLAAAPKAPGVETSR